MDWTRLFRWLGREKSDAESSRQVYSDIARSHGGAIHDEATLLGHFHHVTRIGVDTRLARAKAGQSDPVISRVYDSVRFYFVRNIRCNAVTVGHRQHNFILAYAGTPPILAALSRVVAAWSAIESDAGDGLKSPPTGFIEMLLGLAGGLRDEASEAMVDRLLEKVVLDGERDVMDRELFGAMLSFITHHELAHIVRGHVDMLSLEGLPATILESMMLGEGNGGRLRQWMELDADEWAVRFVIDEAMPRDLRQSLSSDDVRLRLRRLILALGLLFLVLEPVPRTALQAANSSHPYTPLRLAHAAGLAAQMCAGNTNIAPDDLEATMVTALGREK